MSNRRKPLNAKRAELSTHWPSQREFNRLARSTCDVCGSPVEWVSHDRARAHGFDPDQSMFALSGQSVEGLETWICTGCDNAGIMGPIEFGEI